MKFTATLFVEGKTDEKFILDFVKDRFNYSLRPRGEIQQTEGKDSLGKFQNNFRQSTEKGLANLVIFDANGNYQGRQEELNSKKIELGIDFEIFLLPNNNSQGDLETLLDSIVPTDKRFILDCFDGFNSCITDAGQDLLPFDRKVKIYTYGMTITKGKWAKEASRDYLNQNHWNIKSDYLKPLEDFLRPYFHD